MHIHININYTIAMAIRLKYSVILISKFCKNKQWKIYKINEKYFTNVISE